MTVEVTWRSLSLRWIARIGFLYEFFGFTFLLLGAFVFWRRPEEPSARVFLLFCLAVAVQRSGEVFSIQPSLITQGWPFWLSVGMDQLSWWLILGTGLHFSLVFPAEKGWLRRYGRPILALIYGIFPAVGLGALMMGPTLPQGLARLHQANHLSALAGGLIAFGLFLHSYRTLRQPSARAQLRWLAWAVSLSLLPALALYSLPDMLNVERLLPDDLTLMLFLLVPLAITVSIVRYHLWDIDIIIRRSLIYGLLTALLTGLYVLSVTVLQRLSQAITGQSSNLTLALSTLLIALLLQPVRVRVQVMVDRLFFRRQYEARRMLVSFTQALSFLQGTEEVMALVLDAVVAAMDVESASAMVLDEAEGVYRIAAARGLEGAAQGVSFRRGEGVAGWVEREGRPFFLRSVRREDCPAGEGAAPPDASLEAIQAVVCIPLLVGDKAIGLLNLGEKRSQEPYSREDMEVLVTMGRSAALALENARLHEERLSILRQQLTQITAAQEEERRRIARELHDGVGPTLAGISIRLHTAHKLLARDHHPAAEELDDLAAQVRTSIRELRRLIYDLRPVALDELGLVPALREYIARYREEQGLEVTLHLPAQGERLPPPLETALFRIVQEALNNVARHARARRVAVLLRWEAGTIRLRITDDGQGFDPQTVQAGEHVGLWSMQERVKRLNGRFRVESAPGAGTTVEATIPWR